MTEEERRKSILAENWVNVRKKVILPLWNGKFKTMYENVKLDYDDFESLAGLVLCKAMVVFDSEKSNLFTFATRVISKKALTELRDCTQRDVRKTLHVSESVDALEQSIIENIPSNTFVEDFVNPKSPDALSEKMTRYLDRLSSLQKRVLYAMSEGFSNDEIRKMLNITQKELADACAALRSYRNVSILY